MFSTRLINVLLVALSIFAIAQATYVDVKIIREQSREIVRRQDGDSSVGADATSDPTTSDPNTSKTTDTTSPSSTPSPTDDTTSKTTKSTSSTDKPPTSTKPTDTTPTPSNTEPQETSHPVSTVTHVVTETRKDGSKTTRTETDTSPTAGLQDGSGKGTSSGMSTQTRNIVIGVVVGVGGAIVLGGIALVAFRIWGRKKSQHENEDDYTPGYQPVEKSEAGNSPSGRSPFQSTLESYHAPTQVNTASNF